MIRWTRLGEAVRDSILILIAMGLLFALVSVGAHLLAPGTFQDVIHHAHAAGGTGEAP